MELLLRSGIWRQASSDELNAAHICYAGALGSLTAYAKLYGSVAAMAFAMSVSDSNNKIFEGAFKESSILPMLSVAQGIASVALVPILDKRAGACWKPKLGLNISLGFAFAALAVQALLLLSEDSDESDPRDSVRFVKVQKPLLHSNGALLGLFGALLALLTSCECVEMCLAALVLKRQQNERRIAHVSTGAIHLVHCGTQVILLVFVGTLSLQGGLSAFEQGSLAAAMAILAVALWLFWGIERTTRKRSSNLWSAPDRSRSRSISCGTRGFAGSAARMAVEFPHLWKFCISWSFASAVQTSGLMLLASYLVFYLDFSAFQVSGTIFAVLATAAPGSLLVQVLARRGFSPLRIYLGACVASGGVFAALSGMFALEVSLSTQAIGSVALLAVLWGTLWGALQAAQEELLEVLAPGGPDFSYVHVWAASARVLTWIPPFLFAVVNEHITGLRWSLLALVPFYWLAALLALYVDIERGAADVSAQAFAIGIDQRGHHMEENDALQDGNHTDDVGFFAIAHLTTT